MLFDVEPLSKNNLLMTKKTCDNYMQEKYNVAFDSSSISWNDILTAQKNLTSFKISNPKTLKDKNC